MSSMMGTRFAHFTMIAAAALAVSQDGHAEDAARWDEARAQMVATHPGAIAPAIERWEFLVRTRDLGFEEYAGFVLAHPGFPQERLLRLRAENALERDTPSSRRMVEFFDAMAPITNPARARYALALRAVGREEDAARIAREAWRGGKMSATAEAYILGLFGDRIDAADHAARMEALLWQGEVEAARRHRLMVDLASRDLAERRLELIENRVPAERGIAFSRSELANPGVVYNLLRYYRKQGQRAEAIALLVSHPPFDALPQDSAEMIEEMLYFARRASAQEAVAIARRVDEIFAKGTDISAQPFGLRDDYTSLVWLGGTRALWDLGAANEAAPLFYRYGAAARGAQTRSKGFYWAGLAAERAGDAAQAKGYYEMAAEYPDRFYGMLALRELGRAMPALSAPALVSISPEQRAAFEARPLTRAVREVARGAPWRTTIQFFRAICENAQTLEEHAMIADLARELGRRDLAVNLADAAERHGYSGFTGVGFPTLNVPQNVNWTMVHAIARQESQFADNAISHAGARGLMQLMPGTAREQAGKMGKTYLSADLIASPEYNIALGHGYFARMMDYYGGAYPLAVAAYNAGPGNVNKWLRANGDPRKGETDWLVWIEKIPIYETKNYVQRVIENAAVYEHLYPERAPGGRPRHVVDFLR